MPNNGSCERQSSSTVLVTPVATRVPITFFLSLVELGFSMLVVPFLTLAAALLHFVVMALSCRLGSACLILGTD